MKRFRWFAIAFIVLLFLLILVTLSSALAGLTSWLFLPVVTKPQITPTPSPTPTTVPATGTVTGTVLIENGACCIGGIAGQPLEISAAFTASSTAGNVTEMRVQSAGFCLDETTIDQQTWEPLAAEKTFTFTPPINWVGFYVSAQFRDEFSNLSPIICDDISVEGMPAPPP